MERAEVLERAKELGIEHDKRIGTEKLASMIESVTGESLGYTAKEPTVVMTTTGTLTNSNVTTTAVKAGEATIRCIIHSGDRDNTETEMTGSVNGEPFQCQLGVEIDLPVKFIPSFDGAVIEKHVYGFDEDGNPTKKNHVRLEKLYIIERLL